MTQAEKKALAQEIVGDGKSPNKFFVTTSPYIYECVDFGFGQMEAELIDGYTAEDFETEVFDTYEEAKAYYNQVDLHASFGAGIVIIEDRLTGTICERYLQKAVTITYDELEHNDAKRFGYE